MLAMRHYSVREICWIAHDAVPTARFMARTGSWRAPTPGQSKSTPASPHTTDWLSPPPQETGPDSGEGEPDRPQT